MDDDDSLPPRLAPFGARAGRGNNLVTLDGAALARHCPLDNGRHTTEPRQTLGRLDGLPSEVLMAIFLSLDLITLTAFRRVNNRAMETVDSISEYARIVKHCPDVLRAVISLGATCNRRFGSHIYLITCQRVCYYCYTEALDYFPVELEQALFACAGSPSRRKLLDDLPSVISVPGQKTRSRILLYDRWAVLNLIPGVRVWPGALDPTGDFRRQEPRRLMAVVSAPYFVERGRVAHWGFYCSLCLERGLLWLESRIKYTREELLGHLREEHREAVERA
ncbi:hypothetical protein jhhlp_000090 [Lomentospora prolificans]|uniref:F-box domain-containing protein n=1 Tax=Lomentospora prolificans TaxID=41688 RepID=A0A2N3NLM6_9PEZI|nr:hypothetical protein jhhlp_000090 [Lomentospora prolificans]